MAGSRRRSAPCAPGDLIEALVASQRESRRLTEEQTSLLHRLQGLVAPQEEQDGEAEFGADGTLVGLPLTLPPLPPNGGDAGDAWSIKEREEVEVAGTSRRLAVPPPPPPLQHDGDLSVGTPDADDRASADARASADSRASAVLTNFVQDSLWLEKQPDQPGSEPHKGSRKNRIAVRTRDDSDWKKTVSRMALGVKRSSYYDRTFGRSSPAFEVPLERRCSLRWLRYQARRVVNSVYFDPAMGLLILANTVTIGWTIDSELRGKDISVAERVEDAFLAVYMVEIFVRIFALGWSSLRTAWNVLDFILVLICVLSSWVLKPLVSVHPHIALAGPMNQVVILRVLKLLRLVRAVRFIGAFQELWKLLLGLILSVRSIFSALVLLFLILYIFACLGTELISKDLIDDPEVGSIIEEHFSNLWQTMLTLIHFMSMDSISEFYRPLIRHRPLLTFYFLPLLILVSVTLMNLVTAMLVEEARNASRMDEEMEAFITRKMLSGLKPKMKELFSVLDTSGNGVIETRNLTEALENGVQIPPCLKHFVSHDQLIDMFDAFDEDGSGELTEEEFVKGLSQVAIAHVPIETMRVLHLLRSFRAEWREATKINAGWISSGCSSQVLRRDSL